MKNISNPEPGAKFSVAEFQSGIAGTSAANDLVMKACSTVSGHESTARAIKFCDNFLNKKKKTYQHARRWDPTFVKFIRKPVFKLSCKQRQ